MMETTHPEVLTEKWLRSVEIAFQTKGFRCENKELMEAIQREVKSKLKGLTILEGQEFEVKLKFFTIKVKVKRATPERGRISPLTRIAIYPVYADRQPKEDSRIVLSKTIAPDENLRMMWEELVGLDEKKKEVLDYFLQCTDLKRLKDWVNRHYPRSTDIVEMVRRNSKGKVMLVGPSGTGKTTFAKGLADELSKSLGREVLLVEIGLLRDRLVGHSTEMVLELFKEIKHLALSKTVLLFCDEFDTTVPSRLTRELHDEVRAAVNAFLREVEKITPSDNILVIAATNLKENVDFAMDRRFDLILEFKRPDLQKRKALLEKILSPFNFYSSALYRLAKESESYSPADIKKFVFKAIKHSIRLNKPLTEELLLRALHTTAPSRSPDEILA
jgi:SpoVK/Ycf46/Vps4 family AAA+-type ATPase